MSDEIRSSIPPRPIVPGWVETPTGKLILSAMKFVQHEGVIAAIYGGAGVGKSMALRRYADTTPNVWLVTASPSGAALLAALEDIAGALGLKDLPSRPRDVSRAITERLSGVGGLLVIDEAQHLTLQSLEEIRSIHDATQTGLLLCGNEAVYSRLTGGSRKATFAQLFSRIGYRHRLGLPTGEDVAAILSAWNVTGAKERECALQIAQLPGGLRGLTHALKSAQIVAARSGRPVDDKLLRMAFRDLGGEQ